jgi:hypothetical protein
MHVPGNSVIGGFDSFGGTGLPKVGRFSSLVLPMQQDPPHIGIPSVISRTAGSFRSRQTSTPGETANAP